MPEAVVGAKQSDILHQIKTKEGSLTIEYNTKKDIVANTIGHILAIPTTHTILWTWGSAFQNAKPELADQLFERYKDVPWKGDVLVRVGHTSLIGDIKRMLARNEDIRGRPWALKDPIGKVIEGVGKFAAAIKMTVDVIGAKFKRSDYYNPFSNTVVVYHPRLAAGMHELGHAEWFNQMENKKRLSYNIGLMNQFLYVPFLRPYIEWQASANAMKHFKSDIERKQGLKILEGAWGTYLGFDSLVTLAMVSPAFAIPLLEATAVTISGKLVIGKTILEAGYGLALHPYGSSIAGHLMNRLYPKKDQRFGFVFEGKKTDKHIAYEKAQVSPESKKGKPQELSAHQVLVAAAKAPKSHELGGPPVYRRPPQKR